MGHLCRVTKNIFVEFSAISSRILRNAFRPIVSEALFRCLIRRYSRSPRKVGTSRVSIKASNVSTLIRRAAVVKVLTSK